MFRRCAITWRGDRNADRLIVALGQVHPVLQGRFEGFQARRIARVQVWIYRATDWFVHTRRVLAFGQEGLGRSPGAMSGPVRMLSTVLEDVRTERARFSSVDAFFRSVAQQWRRDVGRRKASTLRWNTMLNGLALLQAERPDVSLFAIEQTQVHGRIATELSAVKQSLEALEASASFQSVQRKGGRGLTTEEYRSAMEHRALVRQYNRLLASPERDRSIFHEVLAQARQSNTTVFLLGQAHRSAQLQLARALPPGYAFVWITPAALWWLQAVVRRGAFLLAVLCFVAVFFLSRGS